MIRKYFSRKALSGYLYDALSGSLFGFLIGMWATRLASHFFETRNVFNLWGLNAKKTLISKQAFENIEWLISIIIGFFVFEIFDKVVKEKLTILIPSWYKKANSFLERKGYTAKIKVWKLSFLSGIKKISQKG